MTNKQLNVLFLTHPVRPELFTPWGEDVVAAIGDRHNLRILDRSQPLAPQFAGVDVVIDHGGSAGTRAMLDVAGSAKLWQVLGTGLISDEARMNRAEITALMGRHGFVTYPWEFWHYSKGDAYDHYLNQTGQTARYGAVHVTLPGGSVCAIAEPLTPLNSYAEIDGEMRAAMQRAAKND